MGEIKLIEVKEGILSENDAIAQQLREKLKNDCTFVINLMSSPGAGKTSLLLRTIPRLKDKFKIGVIEADIDSMVDAEKIRETGVGVIQLRTGGFCHLDATMVKSGLEAIGSSNFDLIFIENVGNLVCPAEFDTGATRNVMLLSVPEGDDKPLKYPLMFTVSDVLIISKVDYLGSSDFDLSLLKERVFKLKPGIKIFEVSSKTGEGIDQWVSWLEEEVSILKSTSVKELNVTAMMAVREMVGWSQKKLNFSGNTLAQLIREITTIDGQSLYSVLIDEEGAVKKDYMVWLNNRPVKEQHSLEIPLQNGDRVLLTSMIKFSAGG